MITIKAIPVLRDNYIWIICNDHQQAIIIDPGSAIEVLEFLKRNHLELVAILITHHHWDHTNGISEIISQYPNVTVYGPKQKQIAGVNKLVGEGDEISFAQFNLKLQVLDIPGHTLSHIAFYGHGLLFCGDTLFSAGCGRLFEGTPQQMVTSLQKILSLPNETKIYCAHEYTLNNLRFAEIVEPHNQDIRSRKKAVRELIEKDLPSLPSELSIEKATNPFLRVDSPEVIASVANHANKSLHDHDPVAVFASLRKWKDEF